MVSIRNTILSALGNTSPAYTAIRKDVGKYLHLLQSFYSNTNYVEMQQQQTLMTPHPNLGRLSLASENFNITCFGVCILFVCLFV